MTMGPLASSARHLGPMMGVGPGLDNQMIENREVGPWPGEGLLCPYVFFRSPAVLSSW